MIRVRVLGMMGKEKPKKHTAKEIAAKVDAATTNHGGGNVRLADRSGLENYGYARFEYPLCKVTSPDIKSMQIHQKDCHPKIPFDEAKIIDLHSSIVSTIANSSKPLPEVENGIIFVIGQTVMNRGTCWKLIAPYYVNVFHGVSSSFGKSWEYGVLNGQRPVFHPRCLGCTSSSGNTIYLADQSSTHDTLDAYRLQGIPSTLQTSLPPMMPWMHIDFREYWKL